MNASHRILTLFLAAALAGTSACARGDSGGSRDVEDSNALIMTAEIALQRDDCGRAAANYALAAERLADPDLAHRAAEVGLDCGQYLMAERAAARWRELAPSNADALLAIVRAQLGLDRVDDARGSFETWLRSENAPGSGDALAQRLLQLAQQTGVPAMLAMLRGVQSPALQSGAVQLMLADLALEGWNYREALQHAQNALSAGAQRASAQLAVARAHAGLGDADQAVAAADAARSAAPKEQSFADVDVLLMLGRDRDAREALEAMRDDPAQRPQVLRRLGLLAFNRGDFEEAQRDFAQLLSDSDSSAVAVFYLSQIAERRGDLATALRGYGLLVGTALESAARGRAANILYRQGEHTQALALLRASANATPAARLDADVAQAELLSNGGESEQALARIDDALARSPGHPDLLYQRAIILEKAGRTDDAVAQLESLYRARPDDATIGNALGFILTDHKRDLARAARLIAAALKDQPDNPAILDSFGWLDYQRGLAREAAPVLERAYRLAQDGDIGAHWGEVLWSLGDKAGARGVWNRALLADPDNESVKAAQKRAGVPVLGLSGTGTSI